MCCRSILTVSVLWLSGKVLQVIVVYAFGLVRVESFNFCHIVMTLTTSPPGFLIPSGSTVQSDNEGATNTCSFATFGRCCSPAGLSLRCKLDKARGESCVRTLHKHKRVCLTPSMSGFCGRKRNTPLCRMLWHCPRCLDPISSVLLQSHFLRARLWARLSTKISCTPSAV